MSELTPPVTPIAAHDCPICGGPNDCAAAGRGSFEAPCWCREATFSPDLLARVPEARRGQACVCHQCASADASPDAAPGD